MECDCIGRQNSAKQEMSTPDSGGGSVSHVSSSSSSSALAVSDEHDRHLQFLPSDDHVAGGSAPGHAAFVQVGD